MKKNRIAGTFEDDIEDPPYHYEVEGEITPGGIVLQSRCETRDNLLAVEVYPEPTASTLRGMLVSHDYLGQAFASPILLLKGKKPTPEEYLQFIESSEEHLYTTPPIEAQRLLPSATISDDGGSFSETAPTASRPLESNR